MTLPIFKGSIKTPAHKNFTLYEVLHTSVSYALYVSIDVLILKTLLDESLCNNTTAIINVLFNISEIPCAQLFPEVIASLI